MAVDAQIISPPITQATVGVARAISPTGSPSGSATGSVRDGTDSAGAMRTVESSESPTESVDSQTREVPLLRAAGKAAPRPGLSGMLALPTGIAGSGTELAFEFVAAALGAFLVIAVQRRRVLQLQA